MQQLRKKIDEIDKKIIALVAKRQKLIFQIAELKRMKKLSVHDKKREAEVFGKIEDLALKHDLSLPFISDLYDVIFRESRRIQKTG